MCIILLRNLCIVTLVDTTLLHAVVRLTTIPKTALGRCPCQNRSSLKHQFSKSRKNRTTLKVHVVLLLLCFPLKGYHQVHHNLDSLVIY